MCLGVDVVVEHGALGGELDGLELRDPPLGELYTVVHKLKHGVHSCSANTAILAANVTSWDKISILNMQYFSLTDNSEKLCFTLAIIKLLKTLILVCRHLI